MKVEEITRSLNLITTPLVPMALEPTNIHNAVTQTDITPTYRQTAHKTTSRQARIDNGFLLFNTRDLAKVLSY